MHGARALLLAGLFSIAASAALSQTGMNRDGMAPRQLPKEAGQSAFAAIHEIVGMLESDPKMDWSKVDIDALRQHLIDMDNVTLHARITVEAIASGEHIHVSGDGDVRASIQRMVTMHVAMAGDTADWHMEAANAPDGTDVAVTAKSPIGLRKMKALGLIGMMAEGMHHQRHHMMLATGTT